MVLQFEVNIDNEARRKAVVLGLNPDNIVRCCASKVENACQIITDVTQLVLANVWHNLSEKPSFAPGTDSDETAKELENNGTYRNMKPIDRAQIANNFKKGVPATCIKIMILGIQKEYPVFEDRMGQLYEERLYGRLASGWYLEHPMLFLMRLC